MSRKKPHNRKPSVSTRAKAAASPTSGGWSPRQRFVGLAALFTLVALGIYAPAFNGGMLSDDFHYVANNPYVNGSAPWLPILDPTGEAVTMVDNYAPVHLLLHRAAWNFFGSDVFGHHVFNVFWHVGVSLLLVLLLRRSGLPEPAAVFGGAFFLLHPANVEAVAWISQLKSTSSLLLASWALLLFERRPGWSTLVFALSLFAKATIAFVLPVAAVFWWVRREPGSPLGSDPAPRWLAAWFGVFVVLALFEFPAFQHSTAEIAPMHADPIVQARSIVALIGCYAVMAVTSLGVSAFHEPLPALSLLDPRWLLGLIVIAAVAARSLVVLVRGREEAAWWVWAVIAFVPVSQIFPFPFPLADRYLYMILPGLIGALLLAGLPAFQRVASGRPRVPALAVGLAMMVLLGFGMRAFVRAGLWSTPALLQADGARNYPDGVNAHLLRARQASTEQQGHLVVRELRGALERGYDRFEQVLSDPAYVKYHREPAFNAVIRDMAGRWVERLSGVEGLTQAEFYSLGLAHRVRGEKAAARTTMERGLAMEGPYRNLLRAELDQL